MCQMLKQQINITKDIVTMILLFILEIICGGVNYNTFVDKDIRIFMSHVPHMFLVMNLNKKRLEVMSKYRLEPNRYARFKITKDGNEFRISSDGDQLCYDEGEITKCEKQKTWKIENSNLGYLLKQNNKCMTVKKDGSLDLLPCTDSTDQIFFFRNAKIDSGCESDDKVLDHDKKETPKTNPIIINITSEMLKKPDTFITRVPNESLEKTPISVDHYHLDIPSEPTKYITDKNIPVKSTDIVHDKENKKENPSVECAGNDVYNKSNHISPAVVNNISKKKRINDSGSSDYENHYGRTHGDYESQHSDGYRHYQKPSQIRDYSGEEKDNESPSFDRRRSETIIIPNMQKKNRDNHGEHTTRHVINLGYNDPYILSENLDLI